MLSFLMVFVEQPNIWTVQQSIMHSLYFGDANPTHPVQELPMRPLWYWVDGLSFQNVLFYLQPVYFPSEVLHKTIVLKKIKWSFINIVTLYRYFFNNIVWVLTEADFIRTYMEFCFINGCSALGCASLDGYGPGMSNTHCSCFTGTEKWCY